MRLVTKLDKVAAGSTAVIMSKPWDSFADLAESEANCAATCTVQETFRKLLCPNSMAMRRTTSDGVT